MEPNIHRPGIDSKHLASRHAAAIARAADFFAAAAKRGELPLTPDEFEARVQEFYAGLEAKLKLSNALLLAVLNDEPCPQELYEPWASRQTLWHWRNAEANPLPSVELNGRVCIRPRDFFAALKAHGASKSQQQRPNA